MTATSMAPPGRPVPAVRAVRRPVGTDETVGTVGTVRAVRTAPLEVADCDAAVAMLKRCSGTTLRRRFHGVTDGVRYIGRLIESGTGELGYAAWMDGGCVGIASLHPSDQTSAEMAVLVEDDWQQRGIGTALAVALASDARQRGLTTLTANIHAEDDFLVTALARLGPTKTTCSWGVCTTSVDLLIRDAA
jgi:N-acetylglutamate synthase-like GNAT family acetyltransferase